MVHPGMSTGVWVVLNARVHASYTERVFGLSVAVLAALCRPAVPG